MTSLRPRGADDLGLRRALSDRLLPLLVAAMIFLAALALAGAIAASGLAAHWQGGASTLLTVQVPQPESPAAKTTRADAVGAVLKATPGLTSRRLGQAEFAAILRPWLGDEPPALALALPAVFEVQRLPGTPQPPDIEARLTEAAPGTLVEKNGVWFERLALLARSLQLSAALALVVVGLVAMAVTSVATRAGLAARREAILIVHGLGATDRMIARQFARRVTLLVFSGAIIGLVVSVPLLLGLASITAPFQPDLPQNGAPSDLLRALPPLLWSLLPVLPVAAAAIGWLTAQATVRAWLSGLP
jgi:cell division transport system permease protein